MTLTPRRLILILVTCALALTVAACGGEEESAEAPEAPKAVELALDFTPNPVHAPVYAAVRTGADERHGVDVRIRPPGEGPNGLRLVASGRALVGILDIHDLAIAQESGDGDVVAVGALVQRPLAALLADPAIKRPRDLTGRTVGVSGLPSDPAFVRAIVEQDGGDYDRIKQVTIGFKAVSALLSRKVDAVPAFWNAEGVALEQRGHHVRQFRVEDYGAPVYPEVVFITSRKSLRERRADIAATMRAVADGVEEVTEHPGEAVTEMMRAGGTKDEELVRAQLQAVLPLFAPPVKMDREAIERWADFDAKIGIVERRPDVERLFDFTVAE